MPKLDSPDKGFLEAYTLLVTLCRLNARPPVLLNLVPPIIKKSLIYATYRTIVGDPRQGRLPDSVSQCLCSPTLRLHATAIISFYEQFGGQPIAERLIRAFHAYANMAVSEALFDFTRLWFLCRSYDIGLLRIAQCRKCTSRFAYNHGGDVTDERRCPVCALSSLRARETESGHKTVDLSALRDRQRLVRGLQPGKRLLRVPRDATRMD